MKPAKLVMLSGIVAWCLLGCNGDDSEEAVGIGDPIVIHMGKATGNLPHRASIAPKRRLSDGEVLHLLEDSFRNSGKRNITVLHGRSHIVKEDGPFMTRLKELAKRYQIAINMKPVADDIPSAEHFRKRMGNLPKQTRISPRR